MALDPPNAIDVTAFAWAAKVEGAPLSDEDQQSLDAWLAADARHSGAYVRARAMSMTLDRTAALGPHFSPERDTKSSFLPMMTDRRTVLRGGTALAAVAIGAVTTHFVLQSRSSISTAKGVVQRHPLTDGSSMVLNTASEARLDYAEHARRVNLVSGEARFDVAKDRTRPFVVSAGDLDVRAVGTSFSVWRLADDSTQIVVSGGIVAIEQNGKVLIPRLTAGNMAHVQAAGRYSQTSLSVEAVDRATAWTAGLIDMNGLSLDDAAVQFSRYSDVRIEIADKSVGALRVSGTYSINNPVGFAQAAALSLGLEAVSKDDDVLIRRKVGPGAKT